MKRQSMNFSALRAFEAAGELLSFSKAGDSLNVTHSAISHQIKTLEDQLGVTLFIRSNKGVSLTREGQCLLTAVTRSYDSLAEAIDGLIASDKKNTLNITTTPTFASLWLIPLLGQWRRSRGIEDNINFHTSTNIVDIVKEDFDFGIRCGIPPWSNLTSEHLMPITLVPVLSPSLINESPSLASPQGLAQCTWIHSDARNRPKGEEWDLWLKANDLNGLKPVHEISIQDPMLALQAARDGYGVAMAYRELIDADLVSGRLVAPFEATEMHSFAYYIVYSETRPLSELTLSFIEWLREEAKNTIAESSRLNKTAL